MIQSIAASSNSAASYAPTTKPWAPGDPSSFQQLFNPISTATTNPSTSAASTSKASTPADSTSSSTSSTPGTTTTTTPATTPATNSSTTPVTVPVLPQFTFEQNAKVTGYGTSTQMNPEELATADTANKLATMLGGKVANEADYGGGFSNSAPTRDIVFSGSSVKLNAGIVAYLFNTYGDAKGSPAWQQINQTLGRDPMSTTPVS